LERVCKSRVRFPGAPRALLPPARLALLTDIIACVACSFSASADAKFVDRECRTGRGECDGYTIAPSSRRRRRVAAASMHARILECLRNGSDWSLRSNLCCGEGCVSSVESRIDDVLQGGSEGTSASDAAVVSRANCNRAPLRRFYASRNDMINFWTSPLVTHREVHKLYTCSSCSALHDAHAFRWFE
jgi:hypothetical protein